MNAPFVARLATREAFCAFLSDIEAEDVARSTASTFGWPHERILHGGIRVATQTLAVTPSPGVLLVDLTGSADPLEEINGLAEVCEPGTMVIACGATNDVHLYRALIQAGIHDYLVKPFSEEQLQHAILGAHEAIAGAHAADVVDKAPHVMTAVIGARGGVGCSTIAVSLAWAFAEQTKRHTALLDLDVHFGTGALALDLEPGRGLTDAIENPTRIDGLFLERAIVRAADKLGVLSAEAPIHQPLPSDGAAFLQLQDELRSSHECTLLDLPRHMLVQHPALLHDVANAVIVTELTLAATRDTIRLLSWLRANAPTTRVLVVANKVPSAGSEEVSRRDFESSIERAIDIVLPYDPKTTVNAAKLGKPLLDVAKSSKLGLGLNRLVALLTGEADGKAGAKGVSLLGRIRGLLPHKAPAAK